MYVCSVCLGDCAKVSRVGNLLELGGMLGFLILDALGGHQLRCGSFLTWIQSVVYQKRNHSSHLLLICTSIAHRHMVWGETEGTSFTLSVRHTQYTILYVSGGTINAQADYTCIYSDTLNTIQDTSILGSMIHRMCIRDAHVLDFGDIIY